MKIKNELPYFQENIFLKKYTTFKIGGRAKYFYIAKNEDDLIKAILKAKRLKLPFFVLGGGSKLLISDNGFGGIVIKTQNTKYKLLNTKILAGTGTPLGKLVIHSLKEKLTGLEWAMGIPGTVGGAIRGNAGAFDSSMANVVKTVKVFNSKTEKTKKFSKNDCKFDYRESIFKIKPNLILLSVELRLKRGDKKKIKQKMKEYLHYRKKMQPLNFCSAGSVFKNPPDISAGQLIEQCGLKGKRIGDIKVSEKHANFIVNLRKGKAEDVIKLIKLIKKEVQEKFGIRLEEEIQYLGF